MAAYRAFDEKYFFIGILLQTISNNDSGTTSIKSVSFYIAITLEVFILCFAGEFLSAKVREEHINNALIMILFVSSYFLIKNLYFIKINIKRYILRWKTFLSFLRVVIFRLSIILRTEFISYLLITLFLE